MILASRTFRTTILNTYCRHLSIDCRPPIILSPRPARSLRSRYTTVTTTSESDDEFFGIYSVILPPEPFVFGVSHIAQRPVPPHILRPPYATPSSSAQPTSNSGDGRIQLGSSGERRLRSAARLARNVLEYAGTLVKVKTSRHCNSPAALTVR
jgi:methionyl aminopeptidase